MELRLLFVVVVAVGGDVAEKPYEGGIGRGFGGRGGIVVVAAEYVDGGDFVVGEADAAQPLLPERDGGFVFALGVVLGRFHCGEFGSQKSWERRPNQHCAGNHTPLLAVSNSTTECIFLFLCSDFFFIFLKNFVLLFLKNLNLIILLLNEEIVVVIFFYFNFFKILNFYFYLNVCFKILSAAYKFFRRYSPYCIPHLNDCYKYLIFHKLYKLLKSY